MEATYITNIILKIMLYWCIWNTIFDAHELAVILLITWVKNACIISAHRGNRAWLSQEYQLLICTSQWHLWRAGTSFPCTFIPRIIYARVCDYKLAYEKIMLDYNAIGGWVVPWHEWHITRHDSWDTCNVTLGIHTTTQARPYLHALILIINIL